MKTGCQTYNLHSESSGHTASDSKQGLFLIHVANRSQRSKEDWPGSHSFLVTVSCTEAFLSNPLYKPDCARARLKVKHLLILNANLLGVCETQLWSLNSIYVEGHFPGPPPLKGACSLKTRLLPETTTSSTAQQVSPACSRTKVTNWSPGPAHTSQHHLDNNSHPFLHPQARFHPTPRRYTGFPGGT